MDVAISTSSSRPSSSELSKISPIYQVFRCFDGVGAAYTGKGTSLHNQNFSFSQPKALEDPDVKGVTYNLKHFAHRQGFDSTKVTWPNGTWPHTGQAIKAEDYNWNPHSRTDGIVPVTHDNQPVTYDGIATRSLNYVLSVQGADCPSVFLYDPVGQVIGLAHAGWRPVVRGVISNTINAMAELGAKPSNIIAYIAPGIGDRYNEFQWDEAMGPCFTEVFIAAGREDLLTDKKIRHEMENQDRIKLRLALGRDVQEGTSFMLSSLILTELKRCGVPDCSITRSPHSTIVEHYPIKETAVLSYRYHSFRRDRGPDPKRPGHGLSMSTMFLKPAV
jgi:copper oxidase (laccase) domain-containing protein